ncbi:unnamed protein product [Arctia plantaginis]|uniref:Uncharacterized protein n=1 Tax=Arctia plantaginis TaxID=874455 RepID=A0A8S1BG00_ARCPL|nr:unnamed protein product [Arctia plantaginis]
MIRLTGAASWANGPAAAYVPHAPEHWASSSVVVANSKPPLPTHTCSGLSSLDTVITTGAVRVYTLLTRKQNRIVHTSVHRVVCVRARRISYRPAPAAASRHRPVAPLPELRRIVTRLDMPAPHRAPYRLSAELGVVSPRTPHYV